VREATRALSLAVDRDLSRREAIVSTLANSPALTRGDLDEFYQQARQSAPAWDGSVALAGPDGEPLLNTRRPLGQPLPTRFGGLSDPPSADEMVSNLYRSDFGGMYSFSIRRPVIREGQIRYYLYLSSSAQQLSELLASQQLPQGWRGMVLDRDGRIVAHSRDAETYVSTLVSETL